MTPRVHMRTLDLGPPSECIFALLLLLLLQSVFWLCCCSAALYLHLSQAAGGTRLPKFLPLTRVGSDSQSATESAPLCLTAAPTAAHGTTAAVTQHGIAFIRSLSVHFAIRVPYLHASNERINFESHGNSDPGNIEGGGGMGHGGRIRMKRNGRARMRC